MKNLKRIGCDLRKTVLLDNHKSACRLQPYNGIKCLPYFGDNFDKELLYLAAVLSRFPSRGDVRTTIKDIQRGTQRKVQKYHVAPVSSGLDDDISKYCGVNDWVS